MAHSSGSGSHQDGTTKTTVGYSIDTSGIGYSEISPDIREDFKFLINELPDKLDEVMKEIDSAASITDAFTFEPGTAVVDISKALLYEFLVFDIPYNTKFQLLPSIQLVRIASNHHCLSLYFIISKIL